MLELGKIWLRSRASLKQPQTAPDGPRRSQEDATGPRSAWEARGGPLGFSGNPSLPHASPQLALFLLAEYDWKHWISQPLPVTAQISNGDCQTSDIRFSMRCLMRHELSVMCCVPWFPLLPRMPCHAIWSCLTLGL